MDPHTQQTRLVQYLGGIALRDHQAMAKFYRETVSEVLARARIILRTKEDAEDIANDVFAFVWQNALTYDESRGGVRTWLFIITRSRALDCLRRRRSVVALYAIHDDEPNSPGQSGEEFLSRTQRACAAHRALALLCPLKRQLVDLAFFQNFSHQEIAEAVKMPLGTVKSHLRRTLRGMRAASLAHA